MLGLTADAAQLMLEPNFATVATLNPDGSSQLSIVWIDWDGEDVLFNTAAGRAKPRNLERDPRLSVLVVDREDGYRWVAVRGLAEMTRLAAKLGAKPQTMSGLAGLGDLVLTCNGALSRNRFIGIELGKGRTLKEILREMKMVAEGVGTTAALLDIATEAGVELPITEQVNAILNEGKSPAAAIRDVMERPSKRE